MFQQIYTSEPSLVKSLSSLDCTSNYLNLDILEPRPTSLSEILPKSNNPSPTNTPNPKHNDFKDTANVPTIKINAILSPNNHHLLSTVGDTDPKLTLRGRASISKSETNKSEKRAKSAQSCLGKNTTVASPRLRSMPEVPSSENPFDEFSELVIVSPFGPVENEEDQKESPQKNKVGNLLVVHTKTLAPYFSNVRASPFMKDAQNSARLLQGESSDDKPVFLLEDKRQEMDQRRTSGNMLFDVEILQKVCEFLDYGEVSSLQRSVRRFSQEKEYRKMFKHKLEGLFAVKTDKKEQNLFWDSILNFKRLHRDHSTSWQRNLTRPCQVVEDICKDLDRTLPEYDMFQTEEGRNPLLRVLMAISNIYPEMGYVQGLNSIVGVSLFYLEEEESFWFILYLLERLNIKNIFYPNFEGLTLLNYQLDVFLENYVPEVYKLFKDHSMSIGYYTYSWFITLFADNLKVENVIKIWNYLFIRGFSFLAQFSLAIFSIYKSDILNMDIDEVGPFLKLKLRELEKNDDTLYQLALTFNVTPKLLKELEGFHTNGKARVKIVNSPGKKSYCEPILKSKEDIEYKGRNSNQQSNPTPNWSEQKLRPFFKTVINTITIDFPDTLKHLFRKSPSKTHPEFTFASSEARQDDELILLSKVPSHINNAEKPSLTEDIKGGHNKDIKLAETAQQQDLNEELEAGRQMFGDFFNGKGVEQGTGGVQVFPKRSINTRSRRKMPTIVQSKNDPGDQDQEILFKNDLTSVKNIEDVDNSQQQSLLEIKWNEISAFNLDVEHCLEKDIGNENMLKEVCALKARQSLESNGPALSDTDCNNMDEDVSTSLSNLSARRGVNEYIMANQSRSWPERKV